MGILTSPDNTHRLYLKSSHTLGRDAGVADTLLDNPLCSRLQCIVRYDREGWVIEDKSKNGTWLNGKRLSPGKVKLSIGDKITFPGDSEKAWELVDSAAPKPVLLHANSERYLELESQCNVLPNEENPILLITKQGKDWYVEEGEKVYPIHSGSTLVIEGELWRFYANDLVFNTVTQIVTSLEISIPVLSFDVSLNEENVQIRVDCNSQEKDFGYKAHHVLLLELARKRIEHECMGIAVRDHGWISTDALIQDLGIEPTHLNLLIFRSRKAFESSELEYTPIERRQGEIRLSACNVSIRKGDDVSQYAL